MFPEIGVPPMKSFMLIGFFLINHPFGGTPIYGNTLIAFGCFWLRSTAPRIPVFLDEAMPVVG